MILLGFYTSCQSVSSSSTASDSTDDTSNASDPTPDTPSLLDESANIGVNFIGFYFEDPEDSSNEETPDYFLPETIFADFENLGANYYRLFVKADLLWNVVEPEDDVWTFEHQDELFDTDSAIPIVNLFAIQYASGTPPWETEVSQFQKELTDEGKEYLSKMINEFGDRIKYWEIGNEMDHWRAADDLSSLTSDQILSLPSSHPEDGYSPQEQGVFLKQVATYIKARDADAVIVLPGMGGIDDYTISTWLKGVIEGAGSTDWFDVVNYHYYSPWYKMNASREKLQAFLDENDLSDKQVWLTETGSSSDPTLTERTNYPNSLEEQAADVFRYFIIAFSHGEQLVQWHCYIGYDAEDSQWRHYGLKTQLAVNKPSYSTYKLFHDEVLGFESITSIQSDELSGPNVYKIDFSDGHFKYVVWGRGKFTIPAGLTQMASVVPDSDGNFTWSSAVENAEISLTNLPVILK